ncbi:hypothetical protein, partial [Allocoleopsis sp.]|uniref:hypothetical protein n=1 Tax=Allocoleopsis sp. TaxID=3088169 RepID=UPI002FD0815A
MSLVTLILLEHAFAEASQSSDPLATFIQAIESLLHHPVVGDGKVHYWARVKSRLGECHNTKTGAIDSNGVLCVAYLVSPHAPRFMPSNGQGSTPGTGIKTPDALASAMESINTLSVWLVDAGLDKSAIAQWKFNALAKKFPDLADIIEDAKKLIGSTATVPELGMTVSEVAEQLTEELGRKIKPAQVNQALIELGFQVRPDNGKRIWQLTELGKEYGLSRLATSKTNDWSGPQVTWGETIIPVLIDYFEKAFSEEEALSESPRDTPTPAPELEPKPESISWMLTERIKSSKKKVTASQRLHIEMEAAESYKQRHGKPPAKEQVKGKYYDVYPESDLDLLAAAIERV